MLRQIIREAINSDWDKKQIKELQDLINIKLQQREIEAFGPDSHGLYGPDDDNPIIYTIQDVHFYSDYVDDEAGSINVYLRGYNDKGDVAIYTDSKFLKNIRKLLGLRPGSLLVDYSEAGMQGRNFVNLDILPRKLYNHLKK